MVKSFGVFSNFLIGIVMIIIIVMINCFVKGFLKLIVILLGILLGFLFVGVLGMVFLSIVVSVVWFYVL